MSIYTKSKTTTTNLDTMEVDTNVEGSFRVGLAQGADDLVLNYLTGLYSNPETATIRELFTNACDASDNDSPIKITLKKVNEDNYEFTIFDTGCGMSKKEMTDNYITYAASAKTDDYDVIGSFGLGSKSCLAIVPSFYVESSNGKEVNAYQVSRTEHGIYAVPKKIDKKPNKSYTKVKFDGLTEARALTMNNFIIQHVRPYSKHQIIYYSPFSDDKNTNPVYSNIPKENEDFINVNIIDNYKVSVYAEQKNLKRAALLAVRGNVQKASWLVRVNDIVYPLFNVSLDDDFERRAQFKVVIDVEPGYFAFAPNRESLPIDDKRAHLIDVVTDYSSNIDVAKELKILSECGYSEEELMNLYKRESFDSFTTINSYGEKNVDKNIIKHFSDYNQKVIKAVVEPEAEFEKYMNIINIWKYYRFQRQKLFKKQVCGLEQLTELFKNWEHDTNRIYDNKPLLRRRPVTSFGYCYCEVINNTRMNKKGNAIVSDPKYKTRIVSEEFWKEAKGKAGMHEWSSGNINVIFVFVKEGEQLPEHLIDALSILNVRSDEEVEVLHQPVKISIADYSMRKKAVRKPVIKAKDKIITFEKISSGTYAECYADNYDSFSSALSNLDINKPFIFTKCKRISSELIGHIEKLAGLKVYAINDRTKGVTEYLIKKGFKHISFDDYYFGQNDRSWVNWVDIKDNLLPGKEFDQNNIMNLLSKKPLAQFVKLSKCGNTYTCNFDEGAYTDYLIEKEPNTLLQVVKLIFENEYFGSNTYTQSKKSLGKFYELKSEETELFSPWIFKHHGVSYKFLGNKHETIYSCDTEDEESKTHHYRKVAETLLKPFNFKKFVEYTYDTLLYDFIKTVESANDNYSSYTNFNKTVGDTLRQYTSIDRAVSNERCYETLRSYRNTIFNDVFNEKVQEEFKKQYDANNKKNNNIYTKFIEEVTDFENTYPAFKYNDITFGDNELDKKVAEACEKDAKKWKNTIAKVFKTGYVTV